MEIEEIRGHGHHLAMAASIRVLAMQVAKLANPSDMEAWFTALGQKTFEYVDGTTNPRFDEQSMRAIKEATYATLRLIFDPKGFKI
jgi:hypothetical protein